MSILTWIIGLPLLAALGLILVPARQGFVVRLTALLATALSLVLSVGLFWGFETGEAGYQFVQKIEWVKALGISYHVGVDGVNIGLVLMGAVVGFAAACVSWEIREREKEFYILLLLMIGGILGAFASLDMFFFYFFHELALVPTFIMIGVWGRGERKNYAAFQITMYLTVGALLALAGLIALYVQAGAETFDMVAMAEQIRRQPVPEAAQRVIFPLLLFGFGILVSLWPFHTWAPLGYGSAPTATAMMHAGVVKKFGLYGLIRLAIPLLPGAAREWGTVIAWLCLGNILYGGLVAMRQKDLNLMLGNSSVAHMGFVFLGLASFSLIGVTGAVVIMVAHGLLAALSFGLSGYLYQLTGQLRMEAMGGLLKRLPFLGAAMVMAMLAGCGLPGFANFPGELLVLFGSWSVLPWFVVGAAWGALIIGAVYMLRAVRHIWHGPVPASWRELQDATAWRKAPFVLLLGALLLFGIFPGLLTNKIMPSAEGIVEMTRIGADGSGGGETAAVLARREAEGVGTR